MFDWLWWFLGFETGTYADPEPQELLPHPWRHAPVHMDMEVSDLKSKVSGHKPKCNSVERYRILFVGPMGHGKTSYINTVNNALTGVVSELGVARFRVETTTHKFKVHHLLNTHVSLCDTMGLRESNDASRGPETSSLAAILDGRVNPGSLMTGEQQLIDAGKVSFGDHIHCVVLCINAEDLEAITEDAVQMLGIERFHSEVYKYREIPLMMILNHIDKISPTIHDEGAMHAFRCRLVRDCVHNASQKFGINVGKIFPVQNYHDDIENNPQIDKLALITLAKILDYAATYVERNVSKGTCN